MRNFGNYECPELQCSFVRVVESVKKIVGRSDTNSYPLVRMELKASAFNQLAYKAIQLRSQVRPFCRKRRALFVDLCPRPAPLVGVQTKIGTRVCTCLHRTAWCRRRELHEWQTEGANAAALPPVVQPVNGNGRKLLLPFQASTSLFKARIPFSKFYSANKTIE